MHFLSFGNHDLRAPCHEPPAHAVVFIDPDQVTVHFHDYLDRRTLVKVDDHYEYAR